jgi:hypothetical protein
MLNFIHARSDEIADSRMLLLGGYTMYQINRFFLVPRAKNAVCTAHFLWDVYRHLNIIYVRFLQYRMKWCTWREMRDSVLCSRYADIRLKEYFARRDHFLSLTVEDLWWLVTYNLKTVYTAIIILHILHWNIPSYVRNHFKEIHCCV